MPDFDVQQVVEAAARSLFTLSVPASTNHFEMWTWENAGEDNQEVCRSFARAALAVIVPAVTEQIRALHSCSDSNPGEAGRRQQEAGPWLGDCEACWLRHPCPTVRLLDELDAAARGEQP